MEKGQGEVSQKQQSTGVFNRYLNGVNLAPSNGEDLSEDITTVVRLVRRLFEYKEEILKLFGNFYYSPEEGLRVFCLFLRICFRPSGRLTGFSNSLVGLCRCHAESWSPLPSVQRMEQQANVERLMGGLYADVWRRSIIGFRAWLWGSCITCKSTENTPESYSVQVIITPALVSAKVVW